MRPSSKLSTIKTAQKESSILKILSGLFEEMIRENAHLNGWYITRVQLSPGKTVVYVYIYSAAGSSAFSHVMEDIKIYKPSMRKALATGLQKRFTPDIVFMFDEQLEKTLHMENLLDLVKEETHGRNDT